MGLLDYKYRSARSLGYEFTPKKSSFSVFTSIGFKEKKISFKESGLSFSYFNSIELQLLAKYYLVGNKFKKANGLYVGPFVRSDFSRDIFFDKLGLRGQGVFYYSNYYVRRYESANFYSMGLAFGVKHHLFRRAVFVEGMSLWGHQYAVLDRKHSVQQKMVYLSLRVGLRVAK